MTTFQMMMMCLACFLGGYAIRDMREPFDKDYEVFDEYEEDYEEEYFKAS